MTRMLVVTNMYPPHHLGGYELECRDIVERFRARGHECTVLTSTMRIPGVPDPPGERQGGVRRDLGLYWEDHQIIKPPLRERLRMERSNQDHLRRALKDVDPEVVSVWHMGAMSLGLLTTLVETGLPLIYVICDAWLSYASRHDAWTRLWRHVPAAVTTPVGRWLGVPCRVPVLGPTGPFCFVSEATRRGSGGADPAQYPISTVVYSGIDTTDFPLRTASPKVWEWRLLNVGRVDPTKGVDTAIQALAQLPRQATLQVVGRGDSAYIAELQRLAASLGVEDRVTWSVVLREELASLYARADAFVFPVTWPEPFGLVPVEAMACATPVVATGTGGSAEFILDGWNALKVPIKDPQAVADAVVRLANDSALREALVRGGLATAAELTIDRLADVLEEWHLATAARFPAGRPPDRPSVGTVLGRDREAGCS